MHSYRNYQQGNASDLNGDPGGWLGGLSPRTLGQPTKKYLQEVQLTESESEKSCLHLMVVAY